MGLPQPKLEFDAADYLAWEERQEERHEFIAGEVFLMSGGTDAHYTIIGNAHATLKSALRGGPCRAFVAGMKLAIAADDAFLYPDVFVTCDARDRGPDAERAKHHAALVVEVLSDSTSAYDRGRKFELYQQIDTLQEYLLIEQDRIHADLFRKNAEGLWVLHPHGPGAALRLASVDLTLPIEALYEDVEFPPAPAAPA
ncbi:MAG: Uma2 family endonuclease [Rhodocyclaceae bacterium]|nr:Uma2 family endonuclease [Rhodocyclaceae bacterium]